jgi:hypothetical protein
MWNYMTCDPCSDDYVMIIDGEDIDWSTFISNKDYDISDIGLYGDKVLYPKICCDSKPVNLTSKSNKVQVYFKTQVFFETDEDHQDLQKHGWRLIYTEI